MTHQQQRGGVLASKELAENRDMRAAGRAIVGHFCSFLPLEMLTAVDIVPCRLMGNLREPVTIVNTYVGPAICPYVKSCFDMAMKGEYDFIDGWVTPDACDNIKNIYRVWTYNLPSSYPCRVNAPSFLDEECFTFFKLRDDPLNGRSGDGLLTNEIAAA